MASSNSGAAFRAVAITMTLAAATGAGAQNTPAYPSKPVTVYVGFPAGSTNDNTARTMAHQLSEQMGQQFVVINRDGASGVIAAGQVAKMRPDGYSLMWASASPLVMSPAYNRNTPYDPLKDFAPVSIYFYLPYVLAAHPSVPAKNLRELLALAKAHPGKLSYGSTGVGGALHLAMELVLNMSGTKMLHVPYRGTPAMTLDVIAGQVDLMTNSTSMTAAHIANGRLRAIGVTSSKRSVQLPDVPTLAEAGLPGYEFVGWYSMVAPGGTPHDIVATLNRNFVRALDAPAVKANIAAEGALPGGNTPEEFSAYLRGELDKYTKLVKSARLTPDN
jgi:tripartite-type tricarboxylate transporter receptor subunit TctC